jgi:hypothetical protein
MNVYLNEERFKLKCVENTFNPLNAEL